LRCGKREVEEQLEAIESGRVLRLVCETKTGAVDVTEQEKQRLRQTSKDYWRAAENLRRINSSQKVRDFRAVTCYPAQSAMWWY